MLKQPPVGFIKMGLSLLLNEKAVKVFEQHTLRMVLRDYYIFYTKEKKIAGLIRVHLYCRDKDEACVAYNIGIYNQTMLDFQTKKKIIYSGHSIPKDYLKQIHIKDVFDPTAPPQRIGINPEFLDKIKNQPTLKLNESFDFNKFIRAFYDKKENAVYFLINQQYAIDCRQQKKQGGLFVTNEKKFLIKVRRDYRVIPFKKAIKLFAKILVDFAPPEVNSESMIELLKILVHEIIQQEKNKTIKSHKHEKPKSSQNR